MSMSPEPPSISGRRVFMDDRSREVLAELALEHYAILKNKGNDREIRVLKDYTWKDIETRYNAQPTVPRNIKELKKAWENIQVTCKKRLMNGNLGENVPNYVKRMASIMQDTDLVPVKNELDSVAGHNDNEASIIVTNDVPDALPTKEAPLSKKQKTNCYNDSLLRADHERVMKVMALQKKILDTEIAALQKKFQFESYNDNNEDSDDAEEKDGKNKAEDGKNNKDNKEEEAFATAVDAGLPEQSKYPTRSKSCIKLRQDCVAALRKLCEKGVLSNKHKRVLLTDIISCSANGEFSKVEVAYELLMSSENDDDEERKKYKDMAEEEFADQCRLLAMSFPEPQFEPTNSSSST